MRRIRPLSKKPSPGGFSKISFNPKNDFFLVFVQTDERYNMNPETLQSILIKGDTIFSKDIKETIFKDEFNKMLLQKNQKNLEAYMNTSPSFGPNDFRMGDILSIMEMTTSKYWMWDQDQQMFSGYSLENFTEEISSLIGWFTNTDSITDEYDFSDKTAILVKEIISSRVPGHS